MNQCKQSARELIDHAFGFLECRRLPSTLSAFSILEFLKSKRLGKLGGAYEVEEAISLAVDGYAPDLPRDIRRNLRANALQFGPPNFTPRVLYLMESIEKSLSASSETCQQVVAPLPNSVATGVESSTLEFYSEGNFVRDGVHELHPPHFQRLFKKKE